MNLILRALWANIEAVISLRNMDQLACIHAAIAKVFDIFGRDHSFAAHRDHRHRDVEVSKLCAFRQFIAGLREAKRVLFGDATNPEFRLRNEEGLVLQHTVEAAGSAPFICLRCP